MINNLKRIAIVQMTSSSFPDVNFRKIQEFTDSAKQNNASLICFPENFNYMGKLGSASISQSLEGEYMQNYKNLAKAQKI